MGSPHDFDEQLWIVTSRFAGRAYLGGNAHTHPGHMHAWSAELEKLVTVRADDIVDASPEARVWVRGFLAGNEPSFADWLGQPWDDADERHTPTDPLYDEWTAELRRFRDRGWMTYRKPDSAED